MDFLRPFRPVITWIERILKVDLRYLASGGAYLTLGQIFNAVIGLVLTIAFANLLPIETYGTYRYMLAAYSLVALAALPGLDTAVLQAVSRGKEGTLRQGISAKLRWGFIGTALSIMYAGYQFYQGHMIVGLLFIVMSVALPFMEAFALYNTFFNGRKLFQPWTIVESMSQLFSVVSLVATMFLTKNIVLLMIGYFLPYIIARICATIYVYKKYQPNSETDPELHAYGRSMTIFQIISRIIGSADQIVLYHFLGPAQVAIFSLATAVPNRVQSIFRISGTLAFPKFAERTPKEIAKTLPRKMVLFVLGILVICGVYIITAPLVFTYIFPKYFPSLQYSQVAVFYTVSAITYPFSSYLSAHKKVRDNYFLAIGSFVPKILCLVILVPLIGVWGAIIGLLATSVATILMTVYILIRDSRQPD